MVLFSPVWALLQHVNRHYSSLEHHARWKKAKQRISVLACLNAGGSENLELMIIGTALRLKPLEKESRSELGFTCYSNEKAWITSDLFFDWLQRFDKYIGEKLFSKLTIVLLIGRRTQFFLYRFSIVLFPPNTTSKIQLMQE